MVPLVELLDRPLRKRLHQVWTPVDHPTRAQRSLRVNEWANECVNQEVSQRIEEPRCCSRRCLLVGTRTRGAGCPIRASSRRSTTEPEASRLAVGSHSTPPTTATATTYLFPQVRVARREQPVHLGRQIPRHLRRAYIPQRRQRQPDHVLIRRIQIVLQRIGHQHQHLLTLVQQQHQTQVPDPLVSERVRRHQLERLHLPEMRRVPQHVHEQQLGHVPVPVVGILLLERLPQRRRLLRDDLPLRRRSLTLPYRLDQVPGGRAVNVER